jgi:hypothetical protein
MTTASSRVVPEDIVAVVGMGRSGTSLVTSTIHAAGIPIAGPAHLLARADPFNQRGFWETPELVRINNRLFTFFGGTWRQLPHLPDGWEHHPSLAVFRWQARELLALQRTARIAWKDPRLTITLPFWRRMAPRWTCVVCVRNPLEVYRSLAEHNTGWDLDEAMQVWSAYMRAAILNTASCRRAFVFYAEMTTDPEGQSERLAAFLGADAAGLSPVVEPRLRHH